MYIWNGIKICIEGRDLEFISNIQKYFNASYAEFPRKMYDIIFSIYDMQEDMLPVINKEARLIKSRTILIENELNLKIYEHDEQFWYLYQDIAGIWIDFKNNKIVLSISKKHFSFPY